MSAASNIRPANTFCRRTRREFLWQAGAGFTGVALAGLLDRDGFFGNKALGATAAPPSPQAAAASAIQSRLPHLAPKAKSVIFLFMYGGPSHVDTFDHKPQLAHL